MKKTITLLAFMTFLFSGVYAQYYYIPFLTPGNNPGSINSDDEYPVGGGLPVGWTTILGPTSAIPVWSTAQTIPFTFSFNGNVVTQFKVSSSAILTFDVATAIAAPTYTKGTLPDAAIPDNSVCIWGLAALGTNDNVITKTFGNAPNRQLWIQFSSYGYGTTPSGGSDFTYWSIALEETTNNIYIVDQRTGGFASAKNVSAGIQINATTATAVTGSPNLTALAGTDPTPADNAYYQFVSGTQPAYDLFVDAITTPNYVVVGNNNITGVINNIGTTTITSLTLNYKINSGTVVTDAVTGISIPPLGTYNYSHSIPWNSATSGAYTVECYASDLNGSNLDQNPANDSKIKTVNVLTAIVIRIPLFEIFTSSTCPPCTPGNLNFHSIIDTINQAQHVFLKYQQDFPGTGDPYTTIETVNRRTSFYGINSIPRMENDGGWDGNANSFTYSLYQDARAVPAQYELNGTYIADAVNKTYSAKILYSPLFSASGTQLYTAIVEKTTSQNVKSNGEIEFYNVLKKFLPDENGSSISNIPAGTWDSLSITYTFNGNYRLPADGQPGNVIDNTIEHSVEEFTDLAMIGWLQEPIGNKQVFQAANFVESATSGIYEMNNTINTIQIYPNPADGYTSVDISLNGNENLKLKLIDVNGRTIDARNIAGKPGLTTEKFELSQLAAGVYHVSVTDSKNNSFVKRIVVSHATK